MHSIQAFYNLFPHCFTKTQERRPPAHAAGKEVRNGQRIAGIKGRGLGHIADPGPPIPGAGGGKSDDAVIFLLAQNGLQQCGFTGAVGADKGHHFAAVDMEIHILQDLVIPDVDIQVLYTQAAGVAASAAVEEQFHWSASLMVSML